jgi:hypothetical protein
MKVNRSNKKRQAVRVKKNNTNTIEISGQLYDSGNGKPVDDSAAAPWSTPIPVKDNGDNDMAVQVTVIRRNTLNEVKPHTPEPSHILMRSAVQKPEVALKRRLNVSASTDSALHTPPVGEATAPRLLTSNQKRAERAAQLKQSEQISHFVAPSKDQAAQPVKPTDQSWQPAPQPIPPSPPKSPTDTLLEHALQQASSHEELALPSKKSQWYRLGLVGAPAIMLALIIIGTHSFTHLELRIASAKVGFNTSLPSYEPAGYNLSQIKYSKGVFASKFHDSNGNRYTITQGATSWNKTDLLDDYVSNTTPNYQIVQLGDRTIYLYGTGNATWVSNGIWYQINSDGSLNESQLIGVANSL